MTYNYLIYLIGPFTPWKWRDEIISLINVIKRDNTELFNHSNKRIEVLDPRKRFSNDKYLSDESLHKIVFGDINNCMEADMIFMYKPCNVKTIGTYMEVSHIINRIDNYPDTILISDDTFVKNNPWIKYYFNKGLKLDSYNGEQNKDMIKEYILNSFIKKI